MMYQLCIGSGSDDGSPGETEAGKIVTATTQ